MNEHKGTDLCPIGKIWVCKICNKLSLTRYGFIDNGTPRGSDYLSDGLRVADAGWDESCMMNSELVDNLDDGYVNYQKTIGCECAQTGIAIAQNHPINNA